MSHRHLKSVTYFDVKQVLTTWLNLMMEALMEQWFHDSLTSASWLLLFTEFSSALLVAVQRRLLNERGENDCNCTLSVFSVGLSSCRSGLASIGPINFVDLVIFAISTLIRRRLLYISEDHITLFDLFDSNSYTLLCRFRSTIQNKSNDWQQFIHCNWQRCWM